MGRTLGLGWGGRGGVRYNYFRIFTPALPRKISCYLRARSPSPDFEPAALFLYGACNVILAVSERFFFSAYVRNEATAETRASLSESVDLSALKWIQNGAEPIRASSVSPGPSDCTQGQTQITVLFIFPMFFVSCSLQLISHARENRLFDYSGKQTISAASIARQSRKVYGISRALTPAAGARTYVALPVAHGCRLSRLVRTSTLEGAHFRVARIGL